MRILLIDDEETIILGIRHHLEQLKFIKAEVMCACSGMEALDIVEYFHPELMLVDIRMPNMDGLELIDKINHKYYCPNIIILSAYRNFDYAQRAIEVKVLRYMLKPINFDLLDQVILEIVSAKDRRLDIPDVLAGYMDLFQNIALTPQSTQLKKIVDFIRDHYEEQLSLNGLSEQFHISESSICLLFKKEMSTSFVSYLSDLRVWKAMELLLENPDMSVDQISYRVGYQTNRQLFRLFHKKLKMSPMSFRDQWLGVARSEA